MSFSTTTYEFGIHPVGKVTGRGSIMRKCPHEFRFQLHTRLIRDGRIPVLGSAPLSSWVIARLAYLESRMPSDGFKHNGNGGYQFDVNVSLGIGVVAAFLLDCDMERVNVMGRARAFKSAEYSVENMIEVFVQSMLDKPENVGECCYVVVNPDWRTAAECFTPTPTRDSANEYGWRNGKYLGQKNVRSRSDRNA